MVWKGSLENLPYACGLTLCWFYLWVDHINDHILNIVKHQICALPIKMLVVIFQSCLQSGANKNVLTSARVHAKRTLTHLFVTKYSPVLSCQKTKLYTALVSFLSLDTFLSLCCKSYCPSLPSTLTPLPSVTSTSMILDPSKRWAPSRPLDSRVTSPPPGFLWCTFCTILIWEPTRISFCPTFSKSLLMIHLANGFESFQRRLWCFFVGRMMSYH